MKVSEFILFLMGLLISFAATGYCGVSYCNSRMKRYLVFTVVFAIVMIMLFVALILGVLGV